MLTGKQSYQGARAEDRADCIYWQEILTSREAHRPLYKRKHLTATNL